jgi:hypothetical protein
MRRFATILILLLVPALAWGTTYSVGYVSPAGAVYQGSGIWSYNGYSYTRALVPGYYSGCNYVPSYYQYTQVYPSTTASVTAATPGWRGKLLDLATQRDKFEGRIREGAFEQAYFLQGVKALGLEGNFTWQGYGMTPPYGALASVGYGTGAYGARAAYGNLQYSSAGIQGNTLYGYSYGSVADLYGDKNLALLLQQVGRTTDQAQQLAGQAATDLTALATQEGQNRAKIAEIFAKQEAVKSYLAALQGNGAKITTQIQSFKVVPGTNGKLDVQKVDPQQPQQGTSPDVEAAWLASATNRCAQCHSAKGKKMEAGLDIFTYPQMDVSHKRIVVGRLLRPSGDPQLMPKGGPPLPDDELIVWLSR